MNTSPPAAEVARQFYQAFSERDAEGMVRLYHPQATFHDPVFGPLDAAQVKAMWRMLLGRAPDMTVSFEPQPGADAGRAQVIWTARYPFSQTGRRVVNVVHATMQVQDGLILTHTDDFNFRAWSRQALGLPGLLLGWTPMLHKRVSGTALAGLRAYMAKN